MTLIFAHRGYSALYPENTMLAFEKAQEASADGIEIDVQLTRDGEVVVTHDEKVDRLTNGKGFVKDLSYRDIRRLNAGYQFAGVIKKQLIPSLQEVLEWMKTNKMVCNIELKNGIFSYKGLEEKVIDLVYKYQLADRIILSSFNHYSIVYCYRLAPQIETAPLLAESIYMPWVYASSIRAKGIHPKHTVLKDETIRQSIENGIAVRPYTVNKEKDMLRFYATNCTAIITDDPVKALRIKEDYLKGRETV